MSTCSKVFGGFSHLCLVGSIALTIAGLAQQNFISGALYFWNSSEYHTFSMGLFNSCLDSGCQGSDPFYWSYGYSGYLSYRQQWNAVQAFLLAEVIFRGLAEIMMLLKPHLTQQHPTKVDRINRALNYLHILSVVTGTISTATFGSMPQRLQTDLNISWVWFGWSAILQFIAYGVGVLGSFAYAASRRYEQSAQPTSAASAPLLPGQQVTVIINGQTVIATIDSVPEPVAPQIHHAQLVQPLQQVHHQHYTPNPVAYQPDVHHAGYVHQPAPAMYGQPPMYYHIN